MILFTLPVVLLTFESVVSISTGYNEQGVNEALLELSNLAIQGRQQNYYRPNLYNYPPNLYNYSPNFYKYPPNLYSYPANLYTNPNKYYTDTQQSVMDKLFSIAQNDDLQCVPKLLCEMTSGGIIGRQSGINLPVNINLDSLATFLSGVNSVNMSPMLHFGKAALLGIVSKGNTRSCRSAYPECPSDPDRLIQYLNNHNGGFFRYFQGVNPLQNVPGYFGTSKVAEKRIQNRPVEFINHNSQDYKEHRGFTFPNPNSEYEPYRRGKTLRFHEFVTTNNLDGLDIQRPLPNHVPNPNIFPDRTGTGELKLDLQEVNAPPYDPVYYNQLLYDSFPAVGSTKSSLLSFPKQ